MKTNPFIKFSLCLLLAVTGYAQTSKTYTESFNVDKDVEVLLNANNAEITVETWNINRVEVEATISVELEDKKLAEELLERIPFEALGNSSKVEINSSRIEHHFVARNIHFNDGNGKILTDGVRGLRPPKSPRPPKPPRPPFPEMDFDFDMERFNNEGRVYLQKFQKEIREKMKDSSFRRGMRQWQKDFVRDFDKDSDTIKHYRFKYNGEKNARFKISRDGMEANWDYEKVNKKFTIKIPKDAKLNLNVKRSQLNVTVLKNIDADLNYSGLQIGELTGNNCKITASYSKVDIAKAETLDLELKYSKDVNIGNVQELISISKTSNLVINNIGQKAIIESTFGELDIKNISDDFAFIDINLKNSSAKLKIPHDDINFYINSKSSEFNQNTSINFKMNSVSDAVIYQNSKPASNSQNINIKANFSDLELY